MESTYQVGTFSKLIQDIHTLVVVLTSRLALVHSTFILFYQPRSREAGVIMKQLEAMENMIKVFGRGRTEILGTVEVLLINWLDLS